MLEVKEVAAATAAGQQELVGVRAGGVNLVNIMTAHGGYPRARESFAENPIKAKQCAGLYQSNPAEAAFLFPNAGLRVRKTPHEDHG